MSEQTTQTLPPANSDETGAPEHHFQHEADKTELEKWLNTALTKLEPYSNHILLGFIAVAVTIVTVMVVSRSSVSSQASDWTKFVKYDSPDAFAKFAQENPDTEISSWALLQAGKGFLQEGMRNSLTNREVSDARLKEAEKSFETLLKQSQAPTKAREEALYGLGTVREVLAGDNPTTAIEAYNKLLTDFPNSLHAPWVKQRIAELEKPSNKEFYAWFRKQNPKPTDRSLPSDLMQNMPEIPKTSDLDLLKDSNLILPPTGDGEKNENTVPSAEEMKKPAETPGDASSPAKPFPAPGTDAKPVTDPKPETETPADPAQTPQEGSPKPAVPAVEPTAEPKGDSTEKPESAPPESNPVPEEKPNPEATGDASDN